MSSDDVEIWPDGRRRYKRITVKQQERMFKFIEEHPQLLQRKYNKNFTTLQARRLWVKFGEAINAVEGPKKTWMNWKKSFLDMKCRRDKPEGRGCNLQLPNVQPSGDGQTHEDDHIDTDYPVDVNKLEHLTETSPPERIQPSRTSKRSSRTISRRSGSIKSDPQSPPEVHNDSNEESYNCDDYSNRDELLRKQIEVIERQTMAFESLAQSMRLQAEVFLQLSESVDNLTSVIKDLKKS
ncbi:uncharacterized protein LOC129786715 [Lutzomyia longipalpis]|uniref:uncharacterized protein LOC129786715 n=1 Tax=Lutzomyia longipalpis TaxID=7200 RepID=UPI0024834AA6|nr:uncharacterized protein LOC129786715 [Lutzomyia longipalpis]